MRRMQRLKLGSLLIAGVLATTLSPVVSEAHDSEITLPSIVSANPVDNTPRIKNGRVEALAKIGNKVYVGGTFTSIKNWQGSAPTLTRNYLFAYDATTNLIDTAFDPIIDGTVLSLAPSPDGGLFVGGAFANVNGVARANLVKLNAATGATVSAYTAVASGGAVMDLEVVGSKLYLTGRFSKIKGVVRTRLGATDTTSGAVDADLNLPLTSYAPDTKGEYRLDVTPDGSRLMIIGNFSFVGATARTQIALIDLTTSPDTVANWWTTQYPVAPPRHLMRNLDIDPTGTFAIISATCCPAFDGITLSPTVLGDTVARFEMAPTGQQQPTWWNWNWLDTATSLVISGPAVYVGGHFRTANLGYPVGVDAAGATPDQIANSFGGVYRSGLMALDVTNGVPYNWNPGRSRGYGPLDMIVTNDQLIIGHDTDTVAGEYRPKITAFLLAGGIVPPAVAPPTLPTNLWSLSTAAGQPATSASFDGVNVGGPTARGAAADWSWVRGAFVNGQNLFVGSADGNLYKYAWNGTAWGSPVNLYSRSDWVATPAINMADVASMAYGRNGIYYTKPWDRRLFWAGFNLESGLVGPSRVVSGAIGGIGGSPVDDAADWAPTTSMTIVGNTLYSVAGGTLRATPLIGRLPNVGATTQISGPAIDAKDWSTGEVFAFNG